MEYNNIEISERFAEMFRRSRADACRINGKYYSQEYMAKALNVSKVTVQNWENGTSCPNQHKAFEWFQALGVQPLPYYLLLLYPDRFPDKPQDFTDTDIETALNTIITALPSEYKRKILYWLVGEHGSAPLAVLDMVCAHLQTPLQDRLNVAHNIINNYELASIKGNLKEPHAIQPDIDNIKNAYSNGRSSVVDGKETYCNASLTPNKK